MNNRTIQASDGREVEISDVPTQIASAGGKHTDSNSNSAEGSDRASAEIKGMPDRSCRKDQDLGSIEIALAKYRL